jgi:hypothetical protein
MVYTLTQKTSGQSKERKAPAIQHEGSSPSMTGGSGKSDLDRHIRLEGTPSKNTIIRETRKRKKRHSLTHDRLHLGQIREHTRPS